MSVDYPDEASGDFCAALMSNQLGGIADRHGFAPMSMIAAWAADAAHCLARAGLTPEEPVLVEISGVAEDVAGILAVITAGGVAVPVHAKAHGDTNAYVRTQTGARFDLRFVRSVATRGVSELQISALTPPPVRPLLSGAAMITFTSGSTDKPKGAVLSLARMSAKLRSLQEKLNIPHGAVTAIPLQLNFSFGQWTTFLTLLRGGTVMMPDRFDPSGLASDLAAGRFDYLAAVPTMLRMLLKHLGAQRRFTILTGGEPVSAGLRSQVFGVWPGAEIYSIYGLTESGTCDLFHHDSAGRGAADTLGRPAPGVSVKTDPVTSELLIRTPYAMLGYLDMPDMTAATFSGGWLRTGDMAEILPEGEVRYTGRLKEIINRAGNKVSPFEVETLFLRHPDVAEALVTGAHDPLLGEAIHLLIVPRPHQNLEPGSLLDWAQGRIERFKLPDHIYLETALPLGRTGKADRRGLRMRIEQGGMS